MSKLNPQDREVLESFKDMTVGQIFARARADLGYSLEQISSHLNIGILHLQAIEADDIGNLPPKVYAVGFVRVYADILGLDSEKMAYLFKVQFYSHAQDSADSQDPIGMKEAMKSHLDELPFHIGSIFFILIAASAAILVLGTLVWLIWPRGDDNVADAMIPPVPLEMAEPAPIIPEIIEEEAVTEEPVQELPTEPTDLIVKPNEGSAAYGGEATSSALVFKAVAQSWIEIRAVGQNRILLSRTLNEGDVFYTPEGIDIMFTTGNAAGVEMYLDGMSLGIMGGQGEIIRMRPLSVEALRLQNTPETE